MQKPLRVLIVEDSEDDAILLIRQIRKGGYDPAVIRVETLPVNYLKIDGGFVRAMIEDPMDSAIVQAIHQIGKVAGMYTIAEFVEDDAVRGRLQTIGVDFAQGFAIGSPGPLQESLCRAV